MDKKTISLIILILIIAVIIRSVFSVPQTNFNDDESYYTLRQVESIKENKALLYEDDLSFSGKISSFLPGFFIALSLFYFILPNITLIKIITIIFASISSIIIFLISKKLTNNNNIAVSVGVASIFIPIFLQKTTNNLTSLSLTIPLMLLSLYLYSEYGKSNTKSLLYIISLFALALTSAHSLIFLATIFMYTILLKTEKISVSRDKKEISIFSIIFLIWVNLIFFKKALQTHGLNIIWQNIPQEIVFNYYNSLNMVGILYFIGLVPFILAIYGIYNNLFKSKKEGLYVYAGFITTIFLLLLLRLIKLDIGLTYLGLAFMIFTSLGLKDLITYIRKTKAIKHMKKILSGIIILFIITSMVPAIQTLTVKNSISADTVEALTWIRENTKNDSVILGTINEGHLISGIAKRKNIIDNNLILQDHINERYDDIRDIYTSILSTKAFERINKYNIDYILIDDAKEYYDIKDLKYKDSVLIALVYDDNEIKIYKTKGRIEKYEQ